MSSRIIWSPLARKSFDELISYLESKWDEKVITRLFKELNKVLLSISEHPHMFPGVSETKRLRKCVILKKTLLFYRVRRNGDIDIVIFADARQNPKRYKF